MNQLFLIAKTNLEADKEEDQSFAILRISKELLNRIDVNTKTVSEISDKNPNVTFCNFQEKDFEFYQKNLQDINFELGLRNKDLLKIWDTWITKKDLSAEKLSSKGVKSAKSSMKTMGIYANSPDHVLFSCLDENDREHWFVVKHSDIKKLLEKK